MDRDEFLAARAPRWLELDSLTARSARIRRDPVAIRRLAELTRGAAADLAIARRRFPGDAMLEPLTKRVVAARRRLFGLDRARFGLREFLLVDYWRRVRERPRLLFVAIAFLMVPFVLSAVWAAREPAKARGLAPPGVESATQRTQRDFEESTADKAAVSSAIFTNNIRVAFIAFALGMLGGVGALLFLGYQGTVLGATFGLTIHAGNGATLFEFVFPHGFLELSCIAVAGAAGMRMGWALVAPGYRSRSEALRVEARGSGAMVVGTAIVLVGCGIVEGVVSTSFLGVPAGLAIGLTLVTAFWWCVARAGRDRHPRPEPAFVPADEIVRPRATASSATSL